MAGDVQVAVVSESLGATTTDFVKTGFGTPKACIVIHTYDSVDDTNVRGESRLSIGFSDFTNDFCIAHQDETNSLKVDCDAIKSNTACYIQISNSPAVTRAGTADTITDGVRLTQSTGSGGVFVTVIMFGGADLTANVGSKIINSSENGTETITHSGFTDGNDKLIFFIGTDINTEDNLSTGINNSFGMCHATGSDAATWAFSQGCIGWASDHNETEGDPIGILRNNYALQILTEGGSLDWALEVTGLDHSPAEWTITTREAGAGSSMEVYYLALDLDDRKAKVGTTTTPTTGSTWTPSVSLGFTPGYVGLCLSNHAVLNTLTGTAQGGAYAISSVSGSGEETCHAFYNEDNAATTDTATQFVSHAVRIMDDDTDTLRQDHSFSSFNSGDWTYTINTEDETTGRHVLFWAMEEPTAAGEVIVIVQGSYALTGQAVNTEWGHKTSIVQGSYAYTGQVVGTAKGTPITIVQGSYAQTGFAMTGLWGHQIGIVQGSYAQNVFAVNTEWGHIISIVQGSYAQNTFAVGLNIGRGIVVDQGAYSLNGQAQTFLWGHLVPIVQGSYAQTGFAVITRKGSTILPAQGAYALNGQAVNFLVSEVLVLDQGSYAQTGFAVNTEWGHLISIVQGSYSQTGFAMTGLLGFTIVPVQGAYTLNGQAVNFLVSEVIVVDQGSYTYTGQAVTLLSGETITIVGGTYALNGQALITLYGRLIEIVQGAYTYTGQVVNTEWGHLIVPVKGDYSLTGFATLFPRAYMIKPVQGAYALTGKPVITVWSGAPAVLAPYRHTFRVRRRESSPFF